MNMRLHLNGSVLLSSNRTCIRSWVQISIFIIEFFLSKKIQVLDSNFHVYSKKICQNNFIRAY